MKYKDYNPYPTPTDLQARHVRFRYNQFRAYPRWLRPLMRNSEMVCNMLSPQQMHHKAIVAARGPEHDAMRERRREKQLIRIENKARAYRVRRRRAYDKLARHLGDIDVEYYVPLHMGKQIVSFNDKGEYTVYPSVRSYRMGIGAKGNAPPALSRELKGPYAAKHKGLYWCYRYKYVESSQ